MFNLNFELTKQFIKERFDVSEMEQHFLEIMHYPSLIYKIKINQTVYLVRWSSTFPRYALPPVITAHYVSNYSPNIIQLYYACNYAKNYILR